MVVGLPDALILRMVLYSRLIAAYIGSYHHLHRRHRRRLHDSVWFNGGPIRVQIRSICLSADRQIQRFRVQTVRFQDWTCPTLNSTIWSAEPAFVSKPGTFMKILFTFLASKWLVTTTAMMKSPSLCSVKSYPMI